MHSSGFFFEFVVHARLSQRFETFSLSFVHTKACTLSKTTLTLMFVLWVVTGLKFCKRRSFLLPTDLTPVLWLLVDMHDQHVVKRKLFLVYISSLFA